MADGEAPARIEEGHRLDMDTVEVVGAEGVDAEGIPLREDRLHILRLDPLEMEVT